MNINFLIGTKAQFIKCIPVINEAINRSINVSLYDLKQHAQTTDTLKVKIKDNYNYIELNSNSKDLGSYWKLINWFFINLIKFCNLISKNSKTQVIIAKNEVELSRYFRKNLISDEIVIGMGAGLISKWMLNLKGRLRQDQPTH